MVRRKKNPTNLYDRRLAEIEGEEALEDEEGGLAEIFGKLISKKLKGSRRRMAEVG